MATGAQVTLNGRFPAGTVVRLVKVRDEGVLRSEGGEEVDVKKVGDDGTVTFKSGVEAGARYFIVGTVGGFPVEVRARGNAADADVAGFQAPIGPDRVRLSDGSFLDESPAKAEAGFGGVGPAPSVQQARGKQLRSDTPRGYAHPVEPGELAPYPEQDDVADGEEQRSDTPSGQATPVGVGVPVSQSEVRKGTEQRSDTPLGYATPIPKGDAVQAQLQRESAETKATIGEPGKAAALPADLNPKQRVPEDDPAVVLNREALELVADLPGEEVPGVDVNTDGLDGQGQPVSEDVGGAAGVEPASKPAEAKSSKK